MPSDDQLKNAWRSQDRVSVDAESLLGVMRRNQRSFRATIFWRDFREVVILVACAVFFTYTGLDRQHYSWLVLACLCVGVGLFFIVDRLWHRRPEAGKGEALADCARNSLAEVRHQRWLLKNIFWWYLLPPSIGMAAVAIEYGLLAWQRSGSPLAGVATAGSLIGVAVVVDVSMYFLNRWAVRKELEPRIRELEALLDTLDEEHKETEAK